MLSRHVSDLIIALNMACQCCIYTKPKKPFFAYAHGVPCHAKSHEISKNKDNN